MDEKHFITDFAPRLLAWYDRHGRRGLPWQGKRDAYAVWVAEIMLQQTQVGTVIPYYQRFIGAFPDVEALAAAELDQVLHLWSGLGYYARARNLHCAARRIRAEHGGVFPDRLETVMALPGIGRSTAGAILAQAFDQRHPILDGNVKRVLCRLYAIEGWPGHSAVQKRLWRLAEHHTPGERVGDYTQAIMDLGATLCRRGDPSCAVCPFSGDCLAFRRGLARELPVPKPRRALPRRSALFLVILDESGRILLERRPPSGIWGGLWSLPECEERVEPVEWCRRALGYEAEPGPVLSPFVHTFSHFQLKIEPVVLRLTGGESANAVMDARPLLWYNRRQPPACGIAAPVRRLLEQLDSKLD